MLSEPVLHPATDILDIVPHPTAIKVEEKEVSRQQ
jgi:hypothetical protein